MRKPRLSRLPARYNTERPLWDTRISQSNRHLNGVTLLIVWHYFFYLNGILFRWVGYPKGMHTIDLSGKAALITGGTRNIGRAIAQHLAEAGADVALFYRIDEARVERKEPLLDFAEG